MTTESSTSKYTTLLAVLDTAVDAIISVDHDHLVFTYNPAAQAMFQYSPVEVIGNNINMLMPKPHRSLHDQYVDRYLETGEKKIIGIGREVECLRKDGSVFHAHLTISHSDVAGKAIFTGILRDLTERDALRSRAQGLAQIIDNSQTAIYVVDPETLTFRYANESACSDGQRLKDSIEGQNVSIVFPGTAERSLTEAIAKLQHNSRATIDYVTHCAREDGSVYPVGVHLFSAEFAGQRSVILSVNDLSREHDAEIALVREKAEHALVLRYAPIGIVTMNSNGRVISTNRAAMNISGYEESELLGRLAIPLVHTDDQLVMKKSFVEMINHKKAYSSSVHQMRRSDGRYVPIRTYNAVIHEALKSPILVCMFEDLSEAHALETEQKIQRERLAHVAQLTQMGEMAAGLAHELNQPLSAIATYSAGARRLLASETADREALLHACESIEKQAQRAGNVIRRIRHMTRRHEASRSLCALNPLITNVVELTEIDIRHSRTALQIDLGDDVVILADPVQIEQVLLNFIRNAIDAVADMPDDRHEIVLSSWSEEGAIFVAVRDHGPGVDADKQSTLFDPFVTTKAKGMGMGLSISKSIIDVHDGAVGFTSPADGGASFWFRLPIVVEEELT